MKGVWVEEKWGNNSREWGGKKEGATDLKDLIEKRKGERKQKGRRRQKNKETSEARRREERKMEI